MQLLCNICGVSELQASWGHVTIPPVLSLRFLSCWHGFLSSLKIPTYACVLSLISVDTHYLFHCAKCYSACIMVVVSMFYTGDSLRLT